MCLPISFVASARVAIALKTVAARAVNCSRPTRYSSACRKAAAVAQGQSGIAASKSAPRMARCGTAARPESDASDGGDAEDEGGDVEREDEQRQQGAAAAGAERERGAEAADQAQGRRAQCQRQDEDGIAGLSMPRAMARKGASSVSGSPVSSQ